MTTRQLSTWISLKVSLSCQSFSLLRQVWFSMKFKVLSFLPLGSSGSRSNSITPSNKLHRSKTTHGVLGLLGWGLILPYGAIVARYFKHKDPLWYYLHIGFQFVGFIFAVATGFVGLNMYIKFSFHATTHKGIGITAIVLSILQVKITFTIWIDFLRSNLQNFSFKFGTYFLQKTRKRLMGLLIKY